VEDPDTNFFVRESGFPNEGLDALLVQGQGSNAIKHPHKLVVACLRILLNFYLGTSPECYPTQ